MTNVDPDQYPIMAAITPARTLAETLMRFDGLFYGLIAKKYGEWTDEFLAENYTADAIEHILEQHRPVIEQHRLEVVAAIKSAWLREGNALH